LRKPLTIQRVDRLDTNWFETAYQVAKLAETVERIQSYVGAIQLVESDVIFRQVDTGGPFLVMFCTKPNGWFAPRVSRIEALADQNGDLFFSFTDESVARYSLWRIPLHDLLDRIKSQGIQPSLDRGKAYSLNIRPGPDVDFIKQLAWDIRPYRLEYGPTDLTRITFRPEMPQSNGAQPASRQDQALDISAWLEQWKIEATDPTHPNHHHANLDFPAETLAAINPLLDKLRHQTEAFSREDVIALFGALNSGQRTKNRVAEHNDLTDLRQALLDLLDGPGAADVKIAAAGDAIHYAGPSMLGELYGWANAETTPLWNNCATNALAWLGYDFDPYDYNAFLLAHEQFKQVYQAEVGQLRPDLPLNLEIDKFYNVIDKVDRQQDRGVEQPFQELMQQVAAQLPAPVCNAMETEKRIFSRILKNDFGQGGAWPFYWGAFYPKGGKRVEDAQLSLGIHPDQLHYGFYIGELGSEQRKRFQRNCRENRSVLSELLEDLISEESLLFGSEDVHSVTKDGQIISKATYTWSDFLSDPTQLNNDVSVIWVCSK